MSDHRNRIAVLFPNTWDFQQFGSEKYAQDFEFLFWGSDLFSFPGNFKLLSFDAMRSLDKLTEWCRLERIDGVLSSDEYIGAIFAAEVARRLGLPGNDPAAIIRSQHKYHSRVTQQRAVPEHTPAFELVRLAGKHAFETSLPYPVFTKPCKGTYSLYASQVDSKAELRRKLRFSIVERLVLNRMVRPFNDCLRALTDLEQDATAFLAEEVLSGDQITVDGFVFNGEVTILGIIDSVMFAGTQSFERFEYPSRVASSMQRRIVKLTKRIIAAHNFTNGQFNVEFFYRPETDELKIIEINPRLSYQFADLYQYIDGSNTYDVLLDLTLGRRPKFNKDRGDYNVCASFVLRSFAGRKVVSAPTSEQVDRFKRQYTDSTVKLYCRAGSSTFAEMRTSGSYRCAIVNAGAQSYDDLATTRRQAIAQLPFEII